MTRLRSRLRQPSLLPVTLGVLSVAGAVGLATAAATGHEVDFEVYRMGASQVTGHHLYQAVLPHHNLPFTYPPFAALVFLPFTWLSEQSGKLAWSLLNAIAIVPLIAVSIHSSGARWPNVRIWIASVIMLLPVLLFNPYLTTLYLGQVNFFIILLVLADLTCVIHVRGLTVPRGVLLGVACAIKLTPLIFLPFLFLTRQFRAALTALTSFALCVLAAFAIAPASSETYWSSTLFASRRSGNLLYISDQNLHSAVRRLIHHPPALALLGILTMLYGIGGLAVAVWADRTSSRILGILLCATTGLILSPVSWSHHYVWLAPVLAWLVLGTDRPRHGRWWALGAAILFWAAPIMWIPDPQHGYGGPLVLILGNSFFISATVFLLSAALLLRSRGTSGRAVPEHLAVANDGASAPMSQPGGGPAEAPLTT